MNLPEASHIRENYESSAHAFVVLRGGLAFGLDDNLNDAYGFNEVHSSFVSSQRKNNGLEWEIIQDSYGKFQLTDDNALFLGEIIAGGTTIKAAMPRIIRKAEEEGKNIRALTIINAGVENAEIVAADFHRELSSKFKYDGTTVVYLEGRFGLAQADTSITVKAPVTDFLIGHNALLSPDFELELYNSGSLYHGFLQPCVIFDGGARSFAPLEHFIELRAYWTKMRLHADAGMTMKQAYLERWPEDRIQTQVDTKNTAITKILQEISKAREQYLAHTRLGQYDSPDGLTGYCNMQNAGLDPNIRNLAPSTGQGFIDSMETIVSYFGDRPETLQTSTSAVDKKMKEFLKKEE
jgi:hypothetical protein